MIPKFQRLLAFLPIPVAYIMSDGTLNNVLVMLISGLVFWIPYWLAWWLSDGFALVYRSDFDWNSQTKSQSEPMLTYRDGPQGMGLYSRSGRIN
jgi:hypothetical protein